MATLTIRNLNDDTKAKLRQLAASRGHSMEEEARRILNRAVEQSEQKGLATRISKIFAEIGGVELDIPERSPIRQPPDFAEGEE